MEVGGPSNQAGFLSNSILVALPAASSVMGLKWPPGATYNHVDAV